MYKLISLANLVHNINYEKIDNIKNDMSYIKDILSIHNYELVDLVSEGFEPHFNPMFYNSHGVILPSSQRKYEDGILSNIMLCEMIHNKLKPNTTYHNMKMFFSLIRTGEVYHHYYKELFCSVEGNGYISDVKSHGTVYCIPEILDFFSLYTFLLVKDTK